MLEKSIMIAKLLGGRKLQNKMVFSNEFKKGDISIMPDKVAIKRAFTEAGADKLL